MSDRKKTLCPITPTQFTTSAKDVSVSVGDNQLVATVKEFSTGSYGWYLSGKVSIPVTLPDGSVVKVPVQIGMNATAVGSKELRQQLEADAKRGTALTAAA